MKTTENPFSVVGRGNGWICIDKPGGVSVHNDPGRDVVSLLGNVQPVHRLDRETSGLLLLALDKETTARLSRLFAGGKVNKRYKALVHGNFDLAEGEGGIWDRALTKQAGGRKDPAGRGKKQQAITRFRIEDISLHYTLLDITLETGRKHQIRRHAKLAGHPVVGDKRYGSPRALTFLKEQRGFTAMGLHSWFLRFEDGGHTVTLQQPELPAEVQRLFQEDKP